MTNAGIVFVGELDLEGGEMVTVWLNGLGKTIGGNELGISVEYNGNNFPKIISCEN